MRTILKVLIFILLLIFSSCTTFTSYQSAQTTPAGHLKLGGAITPIFIAISDTNSKTAIFLPIPETEVKLGLSDNLDLGARWGFGPGLSLNTKYQFLKNNFDGAIFLEGSFYGLVAGGSGFGYYSFKPTFLLSREKPNRVPISLGLGLYHFGVMSGDASGGFTSLCGHLGIPARIGANRNVRIMPELTLLLP
ncbi:MAG: hypothetical protein N2748_04465, partial [candidate division WOR-3 bacterium]|nr:hypothetical protein [candidate division WOR-3 bacterium]